MALTRTFLKGLDLTDEQIAAVIEGHNDTVAALKEQIAEYKDDAATLKSVQKELDALKASNSTGEEWEKKYNEEHKAFEDFKAGIDADKTRQAKVKAYEDLLKSVGVSEKRIASITKVAPLDEYTLDKDGNIKDADKVKESIKKEWSDFITSSRTSGANTNTPPGNDGGNSNTNDIYKKDDKGRYIMSTKERQEALAQRMLNNEN